MEIRSDDSLQHLLDHPPTARCPICGTLTSLFIVSMPRNGLVKKYQLKRVGLVFRCGSCNGPVFSEHVIFRFNTGTNIFEINNELGLINRSLEPFEMNYLPSAVTEDFKEALICYANNCWNAFAAMCRRSIQSACESLGAAGKDKVQNQINELRDMGVADEETFDQLKEIMISGHDGAHPHLPALTAERAAVLMQLMKDVFYQLFVRPAKIKEASELRKKAIAEKKQP